MRSTEQQARLEEAFERIEETILPCIAMMLETLLDASEDIARELERCISNADLEISEGLQDFIEGQLGRKIGVQLPLPLQI